MRIEITKHDLLAILQARVGRAKALGLSELAGRLRCSQGNVRRLVDGLRLDGIAVCGHPGSGYFIAGTAEELEQTCRLLRDQAVSAITLEARLRGVPAAQLILSGVVPGLQARA